MFGENIYNTVIYALSFHMKPSFVIVLVLLVLTGASCSMFDRTPTAIDIRPVEIVSEYNAVDDDRFDIKINKPRTEVSSIDARFDAFIQQEQEAFMKSIEGITLPEGFNYEFSVDYRVVDYSDTVKTFVFDVYQYTGGAHGLPYTTTMTFDFETESLIELKDLFKPGSEYLQLLSDLASADLLAREDGMMGDEVWVREGTAPTLENFARFALTPRELILYFDVYQVAPYAAGKQEVVIPLARLSDVLAERFVPAI